MTHAFIFPGQGSQSVGMLADLNATYPIVQQTFEQASDILHYDLWKLSQNGPKESLNQTEKTQPVLLAASVALWRIWQDQGGSSKPSFMAGHSFGEYSALVCAGALAYEDAVSLAQDRGRFMQAAVPEGEGAMAAILGLKDEQVIEACKAQAQVVSAVNFNAPGQVVIAGNAAGVEAAIAAAKKLGAKKAIKLPVSVPSHSSLMKPAAEQMAERLKDVTITVPKIAVIHNVDTSIKTQAPDIATALVQQLHNPVLWVATIEKMIAEGVTTLIECGAGKVLTGLNKRISRQTTAKTLEQALETAA
ncbi:ACP S-malonyltransferase [Candidatus Marithrix sp. Canyon 246]|uniref:ACP S-malonyltransferase n=1 Tax=Candidatus Marithrix sp. Canyon 246 TaxID=1827136 RepID=UPI00084A1861|nr:ACP S-malonyltransferase [Candidatus Marithrix sp. Canyon 246]